MPTYSCVYCTTLFTRPPAHARGVRTFCSRQCRNAWVHRAALAHFWEQVEKTSTCWLWTGSLNRGGYGAISLRLQGNTFTTAHRFAWVLHHGPLLLKVHVLHRCDVRRCVRPDHLFLGTNEDNVQDATTKGRQVPHYGEAHGNAILTEQEVRAIHGLRGQETVARTAERFQVDRGTVSAIQLGKAWTHLNLPKATPRVKGEYAARLTHEQVWAIRASTVQNSVLARMFGLSTSHIQRIRRGDAWKHLPDRP